MAVRSELLIPPPGFEVIKIEDDELNVQADIFVAEQYQVHSGPKGKQRPLGELVEFFAEDPYQHPDRSDRFVVKPLDEDAIAGHIRAVKAKPKVLETDLEPVEAMELMEGDWPHIQQNIAPEHITEYGRLTVAGRYRTDKATRADLLRSLTDAAHLEVDARNVKIAYSMMPRNVAEAITKSRRTKDDINNYSFPDLRLKTATPQVERAKEMLPLYFANELVVYAFDVPKAVSRIHEQVGKK